VAFGTSVLGLGSAGHTAAVAASMNPELSEITEDLVLTEPFVEHPHNAVLPANAADVAAPAADPAVQAAVGRATWAFMTRAEVLLHGDLHTGSVFVRAAAGGLPRSTRAFEAEWRRLWPTRRDPRVYGDAVLDDLLARARADATTYAGAETVRRVVGFAEVSDVESLPEDLRAGAVRGALRAARELLLADGADPASLAAGTATVLRAG
jgi:5-methylthioribose kinase